MRRAAGQSEGSAFYAEVLPPYGSPGHMSVSPASTRENSSRVFPRVPAFYRNRVPWKCPEGNKGRLIFLAIVAGPTLYVGMLAGRFVVPHLPITYTVTTGHRPSTAAILVGMFTVTWFLDRFATAVRDVRAIVRIARARRREEAMLAGYLIPTDA